MATLQKIRNRAGLLVAIVIGLALAAFILGDLFRSGNPILQRNAMEIGEIEGESIQYTDFQARIEEVGEIYRMNSGQNQIDEETWVQIREQTWQNMVREILMGEVYEDIGISVSPEELYDMVQGSNIHPIVQQIFTNPNNNQVDRNAILRFLKSLETTATPEYRDYWLYLEKQIADQRVLEKYNNLVSKGLYVPNEEAQRSLNEKNHNVSFKYISLPYNSVSDSLVVMIEKDLRNYYSSHKENYKQESVRRIEYVTFKVEPSPQDNEDARNWIEDIKSDFSTAEDNAQFVNTNSDVSFDDTWFKKEGLPENIGGWIFDQDAVINDVFGPYFETGAYKLAKYHATEMRPDSVQARHILLSVETSAELESKQALADSLKMVVENGGNFAALAREFSDDQGSAVKGGDLGFFSYSQMVKPFAEAAFNNAEGEVSIAVSQFGIHVVQTTKRGPESKHVQVAYLIRNVVPSDMTYQRIYAQASRFASENTTLQKFNEAVIEQNLNKRIATVRENDRVITGLQYPRAVIRSAFDAKEGEILEDFRGSAIFELGDNYVIAVLTDVKEEGIAPFEDVRARVELAVIKEKKAEYLIEKAASALEDETDMVVIAQELGSEVNTQSNINFSSFSVPGIGLEPALVGTVVSLDEGIVSNPVKGNNGVYIVQITGSTQGTDNDIVTEQQRLSQSLEYRAANQTYQTRQNSAEIADKRSKFF